MFEITIHTIRILLRIIKSAPVYLDYWNKIFWFTLLALQMQRWPLWIFFWSDTGNHSFIEMWFIEEYQITAVKKEKKDRGREREWSVRRCVREREREGEREREREGERKQENIYDGWKRKKKKRKTRQQISVVFGSTFCILWSKEKLNGIQTNKSLEPFTQSGMSMSIFRTIFSYSQMLRSINPFVLDALYSGVQEACLNRRYKS